MDPSRCSDIRLGNKHHFQRVEVTIPHRQWNRLVVLIHQQHIRQQVAPMRPLRNARKCRLEASSSTSAEGGTYEGDVPTPRRGAAIALPRFLNSPGKVFALAGFLKILVITLHTVPVGFSCPTGLAAASTMVPFGLALVLLSRYLLERDFMRWEWAAPFLVLASAVLIWLNGALLPARAPVQQQGTVNTAAEVRRARQQAAQTPATRSSPRTAADAQRLWDKYERVAEERSKAAAEKAK